MAIPFKDVIYEIISAFLLYLDAEDIKTEAVKVYPGDTPEYPWSSRDALQNDMRERAAIYFYAIRHLNLEGHKDDTFKFYQAEDVIQPHAHNIFLQMGYEFGIIAMIVFILMFIAIVLLGVGNIRKNQLEYICPVLLVIGFAVFGMFDVGFEAGNGMTAMVFWIAICIRGNQKI